MAVSGFLTQPPTPVTMAVPDALAWRLNAFCEALAQLAAGLPSSEYGTLDDGLSAVHDLAIQMQSGGGFPGLSEWKASYTRLEGVGRSLLSMETASQALHCQLDSSESLFGGTWLNLLDQAGTGALSFQVEGPVFRVLSPVEQRIPLPTMPAGWTPAPQFAEQAGDGPSLSGGMALFGVGIAAAGVAAIAGALLKGRAKPAEAVVEPSRTAASGPPPPPVTPMAPTAAFTGPPPPPQPSGSVPQAAPPPAPPAEEWAGSTVIFRAPGLEESSPWRLVVEAGALAGKAFEIRGRMHIGRTPQNEIHLPDDTISRKHAVIEIAGGNCMLSDCGSSNGTFLNGQRLNAPTPLSDRDTVMCGSVKLKVAIPAAATSQMRSVSPSARPSESAWAPQGGGQPMPATQTGGAPRYCPHCGAEVEPGTVFCGTCGARATGVS